MLPLAHEQNPEYSVLTIARSWAPVRKAGPADAAPGTSGNRDSDCAGYTSEGVSRNVEGIRGSPGHEPLVQFVGEAVEGGEDGGRGDSGGGH